MNLLYSSILIIVTSFSIICCLGSENNSSNRSVRKQSSLEDEKGKKIMENEDEELTKMTRKGKLEVQASNEQSNPRKRSSQDRSTSSQSHESSRSMGKGKKKLEDKKTKSVRMKTVSDWVNDPRNIARVKDEPVETELVVPKKIKKKYERLPSDKLFYRFLEGTGSAASNDEFEKSVSGSNTIHEHTGPQTNDTASSRIDQTASASSRIKKTNSNISGISETNQNMGAVESNRNEINYNIRSELRKVKREPDLIRSTSSSVMNQTLSQSDRTTSNIKIDENTASNKKHGKNELPNPNPPTSNERDARYISRAASRSNNSPYEVNQSGRPSNSGIKRNQRTSGSDQPDIKPDPRTGMLASAAPNMQIDSKPHPHTLVFADHASKTQAALTNSRPIPHTLVLADSAPNKQTDRKSSPNLQKLVLDDSTYKRKVKKDNQDMPISDVGPSKKINNSQSPLLIGNPSKTQELNQEVAISRGIEILKNVARRQSDARNFPGDASTSRIRQNASNKDLPPLTESEWGKECVSVTNSLISNEPLQRRVNFNPHLIRNAFEARREQTPNFRPSSILKEHSEWNNFYAKYNFFKMNLGMFNGLKKGDQENK